MGIIELEGLEFYGYHGCFVEEQVVGNKFIVYVRMEYNAEKAVKSDQIGDALNYQRAYEMIKEQVQITSHLLEHVGQRILDVLYEKFPELEKATVKVSKMNPPMGGQIEKVSLTLSR
ncbi:dihydroneopterin aldolase [Labilibaculum sp. DW002]|uniref:7,8-dihydroneopterin aldolase n=1 Tax=Paralabilibaculum antarcticum TaxID=2912572 RepID=A0ABT5VV63_9BACT|nr:dihydroneopterin aldolase [Labilibaculum sp. DW002]MDE5419301.1 dihydroneopterin aldolase [Labilibaculum sp. DW002]